MNLFLSILFIVLSFISTSVSAETFKSAANFELPDIYNGNMVSLEDYRGSVVLVDFWASWCGPCQASLPEYNKLRNKLQATLPKDKFEILAINVDGSREEAMRFLNKHSLTFPILKESSGKSQRAYELLAMPTSFLVDQQGFIRIAHAGFNPGYIVQLENEILKLVNEE
mgnify:CR=1 FL=1